MSTLSQLEDWMSGNGDGDDYKFDGAAIPFLDAMKGGTAAEQSGVKSLMIAILEEGIRGYFSPKPEERGDAEAWIGSGERGYVFAFMTICDTLDINGEAVRSALQERREADGFIQRRRIRTRNNVRHAGRLRPKRERRRSKPAQAEMRAA